MSISIKANSIIGLEIITVDDGKKVNTAKEVIYDALTNQVKGIVVDEKGWFQNAKIILIKDIDSIGEDAILIPSEDVIVEANSDLDSVVTSIANDNNFLTKNEVITQSGKKLGRVTDIYFNFPSGLVEAIEISEGFLQNIATGTKKLNIIDIITNGENNLIVRDYAEIEFSDQSKEQGINKVISDTKENVGNLAQDTVSTAQKTYEVVKTAGIDLAQKAGEKTQEIIESEPVQNAIHNTQDAAQNVKETVVQKFDEAKERVESGKVQDNIEQVVDKTKETAQNVVDNSQQMVVDKADQMKSAVAEQRITDSIGKRVGDVVIVDDQDQILATPDDIITHELITLVKTKGNLDQLLDNVV